MLRKYVAVGIVCSILALGAALLIPAVARVREAACRSECLDHMKQLVTALHNVASRSSVERDGKPYNYFPFGTIPNTNVPPERRLSWYVAILPDFEHEEVFKQFDLTAAGDDGHNRKAISHQFRHFVCPSSGVYDSGNRTWTTPTIMTHYVGVAGVGADAATLPKGHPRAGAFGYDRQSIIPIDFPDGMSNTLILMETGLNPGHWAFGGTPTVRGLIPGSDSYIGPGWPLGGFHSVQESYFGQPEHLAIVAMVDGTVRPIRNTIDPHVLEALATAAGKEELPAEW